MRRRHLLVIYLFLLCPWFGNPHGNGKFQIHFTGIVKGDSGEPSSASPQGLIYLVSGSNGTSALATPNFTVSQQSIFLESNLKLITKWIVVVACVLVIWAIAANAIGFFVAVVRRVWTGDFLVDLARTHYPAVVVLPTLFVAVFFLVLILEVTSGQIEFEIGWLKFKGAAGPIVLWALCLIVGTGCVRALWNCTSDSARPKDAGTDQKDSGRT